MSVVGEYRRILDDLLAVLASSSAPAAQRFGRSLEDAQLERAPHVSAAAERGFDILEANTAFLPDDLENAIERERIASQLDHFRAICLVVLGH